MKTKTLALCIMFCMTQFSQAQLPAVKSWGSTPHDSLLVHYEFEPDAVLPIMATINVYRYDNNTWVDTRYFLFDSISTPYVLVAENLIQGITYRVEASFSNDSGPSFYAFTVAIQYNSVGITDMQNQPSLIYPHGKQVTCYLGSDADNAHLTIFNIQGQAVATAQLTESAQTIDLADQPAGYYMVSLCNGAKRVTRKILLE